MTVQNFYMPCDFGGIGVTTKTGKPHYYPNFSLARGAVLTLAAATGAYVLTGKAARLLVSRVLHAAVGAYTLTGIAATFHRGYKLKADTGAYIVTGYAVRSPIIALPLPYTPERDGYSVQCGEDAIATPSEGGFGYYTADLVDGSYMVTCQWQLFETDYNDFMQYYREITETNDYNIPFTIKLIVDDPTLTTHVAYFVPGSVTFRNNKRGYTVSATLEVLPAAYVEADDNTYMDAFQSAYNGP